MNKSISFILNQISGKKTIILSIVAICTGGFIYIFFRPAEPIFFNWFKAAGIENLISSIREKSLSLYPFLPEWFVYSIPGCLWAFSYTTIILHIWRGSASIIKYFWFLTIPLLVFGVEVFQFTGHLPGTFSLNDIIWSAIGILTGIIFSYFIYGKNKKPGASPEAFI